MASIKKIKPRERNAVIRSLRAGVTPRIGLEYIQVGRSAEVKAIIEELDAVCQGGNTFKLIVGDFGAGKSFFMQLTRYMALQKNMVVLNADLSPDRRLQSSGGQARALYQELMRNMSTRSFPDGNAMKAVLDRFVGARMDEAEESGLSVQECIRSKLSELREMVYGYDFAQAVIKYYEGYEKGEQDLQENAVRFLRGEYVLKSDARKDLGVSAVIGDASFYDFLKLTARFVRQAGYKGLLVNIDEMVNLYKLPSPRSRSANYEQILRMLNDCLQGNAEYIGFLMGGTTEFLTDSRKGLYSYEALRSRLALNSFSEIAHVVDYHGPVLFLENLSPEDLYVLLCNIRSVFAEGDPDKYLLPDEALTAFLQHCSNNIGEAYFRTPRNTIRAFVDMLALIEQHPEIRWQSLIENIRPEREESESLVTVCRKSSDPEDGEAPVNLQRVKAADNRLNDDDELTDFVL